MNNVSTPALVIASSQIIAVGALQLAYLLILDSEDFPQQSDRQTRSHQSILPSSSHSTRCTIFVYATRMYKNVS